MDLGQIIIGLIAIVFLIIRAIFEANKNAAPPRGKPPAPPPLPQQARAPAPAAGQQADPLRAQVEEFLRRAGQPGQQAQRPAQRQPPPAREIELLVEPSPAGKRTMGQPLRQAEWRQTAPPQPTAAAEKARTSRKPAKPRRRQTVAEHVAEQVAARSKDIAEKTSKLGQRIVAEDEQFDVQLKAKFDHTVGTLAGPAIPAASDQTPPPSHTAAAQLAAMLANPDGIRQAVLLNEILRRPSERW
jgi:hypothetical protein